ncbi:MAG: alpha/beta fold hydrolase [Gemmatimonadaceae bacterium]
MIRFRRAAAITTLCLSALWAPSTARAQRAAAATGHPDDPRTIIAQALALPPSGIDTLMALRIGGIEQWISVRGSDPANPILLFIHGGPGSPMMPESWTFERPWEDFFTVVQWDQRGAGKTFSAAGRTPDPALTIDRFQADAEELVDSLRHRYGKQKIFLMGHSWGSILGVRVALARPQWLYAYIGVGQVVNGMRNETVGYRQTLAEARRVGNDSAVRALRAIAPYPDPGRPLAMDKVMAERRWDVALGGMVYGKSSDRASATWALSPDYTAYDDTSAIRAIGISVKALLPAMAATDFDADTVFRTPVFIFAGQDDRTTPASEAKAYFDHIHAPAKRFFSIDHAAHYVVNEAPGVVLMDLVQHVLPLAGPVASDRR